MEIKTKGNGNLSAGGNITITEKDSQHNKAPLIIAALFVVVFISHCKLANDICEQNELLESRPCTEIYIHELNLYP